MPTCAEAGVLGALAGVMGSLMAMEVIREIVGFGEGLVGRLLMVDARGMRFDVMRYAVGRGEPAERSSHRSVIPAGAQWRTGIQRLEKRPSGNRFRGACPAPGMTG